MSKNNKSTKGNGKSKNSSSQPRKARIQNNKPQKQMQRGGQRQQSVAVAYASQQSGQAAKIVQSKDSINIVHREFLGNLSGAATGAFTSNFEIILNPGMIATFPWLATIAQNWETYMFKKVRICVYTRCGSTTVGSVLIAPDYDAADDSPPSEQIMTSYQDVVESVPWKDLCCNLRHSAMHPEGKRKFIRTGDLGANLDIKSYDAGNVFVNTVDSTAAGAWGKVWIEYDVTLHTPQAQAGTPVGIPGGRITGSGSLAQANPLGTAAVVDSLASGISVSGNVVTIQKVGTYLLNWLLTGTTLTTGATVLAGATSLTVGTYEAGAGTSYALVQRLTVDTANATITFSISAAAITASSVFIGVVPNGSLV